VSEFPTFLMLSSRKIVKEIRQNVSSPFLACFLHSSVLSDYTSQEQHWVGHRKHKG